MPFATDADIAAIKEQLPGAELYRVPVPDLDIEFVLRFPGEPEYRRFIQMVRDNSPDAGRTFVSASVVWPDPRGPEYQAIAQRYPALLGDLIGECRAIAGGGRSLQAKKV